MARTFFRSENISNNMAFSREVSERRRDDMSRDHLLRNALNLFDDRHAIRVSHAGGCFLVSHTLRVHWIVPATVLENQR